MSTLAISSFTYINQMTNARHHYQLARRNGLRELEMVTTVSILSIPLPSKTDNVKAESTLEAMLHINYGSHNNTTINDW
jgi:hypothetical protein